MEEPSDEFAESLFQDLLPDVVEEEGKDLLVPPNQIPGFYYYQNVIDQTHQRPPDIPHRFYNTHDQLQIEYEWMNEFQQFQIKALSFSMNDGKGVLPTYPNFYNAFRELFSYAANMESLTTHGGVVINIHMRRLTREGDLAHENSEYWYSIREAQYDWTRFQETLQILAYHAYMEIQNPSEENAVLWLGGRAYFLHRGRALESYEVLPASPLEQDMEERNFLNPRWIPPPISLEHHERQIAANARVLRTVYELEEGVDYHPMEDEGGACGEKTSSICYIHGMIARSYKSKEGLCFYAVLAGAFRNQEKVSLCVGKNQGWKIYEECHQFLRRKNLYEPGFTSVQAALEVATWLRIAIRIYQSNPEEDRCVEIADNRKEVEGIQRNSQPIDLLLHEGHYYRALGRMPGNQLFQLNHGTACPKCKHFFKQIDRHHCEPCPLCGIYVVNLPSHQERGNCSIIRHNRRVRVNHEQCPNRLLCHVQFLEKYEGDEDVLIYDMETYTDLYTKKHYVYAVGVCWMQSKNTREYQDFYGVNCVQQFMDYLEKLPEGKYTMVGYNNSGYDNHFLIREILYRNLDFQMVLQAGQQLTLMELVWRSPSNPNKRGKTIRVLDLIRFFAGKVKLRNALLAYGISDKKSYFPYAFLNMMNDIDYVGLIPGPEFYEELPPDYNPSETCWNLKQEALKYLKQDVHVTTELYLVMSQTFYELFRVKMSNYITINQLAFQGIWLPTILPNSSLHTAREWNLPYAQPRLPSQISIFLPNPTLYRMSWQCMFGGRVEVYQRHYVSPWNLYPPELLTWEKVWQSKQFALYLDVCSLYPTAMREYEYPVGKYHTLTPEECEMLEKKLRSDPDFTLPMGIYEVDITPNPKLVLPVLPRKDFKEDLYGRLTSNGLHWDNYPKIRQVYTSVDLLLAFKFGYVLEKIHSGYTWDRSAPLFRCFIDLCFQLKQEAEREKNQAKRAQAKLVMNSVFGKTCQKEVKEKVAVFTDADKSQAFIRENEISFIHPIYKEDEKELLGIILKGFERQTSVKEITKPNYLGSFILSYSKKHMIEKIFHPWMESLEKLDHLPCYTDTDSILVKIEKEADWNRIKDLIRPNELGCLSNELKEEVTLSDGKKEADFGLILEGIWIRPKTYYIKYISKNNQIKTICKSAGIPIHFPKPEHFLCFLEDPNVQREFQWEVFERIGAKRIPLEKEEDQGSFEIFTQMMSRKFASQFWEGRQFSECAESPSLPFFYQNSNPSSQNSNPSTPDPSFLQFIDSILKE